MKLTFLGTGAAFSRQRCNSNLLIEVGEAKVLVDCGWTAMGQLEALGIDAGDITHVIITHLHADHIGGLEELAIRARLQFQRRPTLLSSQSLLGRLWDYSLRGGLEFLEETPGEMTPQVMSDYFNTIELDAYSITEIVPGLELELLPTYHVKGLESYGCLFREAGVEGRPLKFAFTGDTRYDARLIARCLAWGGPLLHDCQLYDLGPKNSLSVHASYSQLMDLPGAIRNRIWLYHYGDEARPDAVADGFRGFAADLQVIPLK